MELLVIKKTTTEGGNGRSEASPPRADDASVSPFVVGDSDGDLYADVNEIRISLSKPYTVATVPPPVKVLPRAAKEVWVEVFNANVSDAGDISASKIAWTAVKNKWKKTDEGDWVEKGVVLYEDDDMLILDVDKATREELQEAREARSKRYGIGVKEGGALTPPKGYPTDEVQYGDPVNYAYPIDPPRVLPARQYFNHEGQREDGGYSTAEWAIIGKRIARASGEGFSYKAGKIVREEEKSEDLRENIRLVEESWYERFDRTRQDAKISSQWIQRVFDDAVVVETSDGLYRYPYMISDGKPVFGEPEKVEVEYKPVAKTVRFLKADNEKRLVYGVVMEPDEVDSQHDRATAEEIELACHRFMLHKQALDLNHERDIQKAEAAIVECYVAPQPLSFPGGDVKAGSWLMVTKIFDDEMWADIKAGELGGYSIKGRGVRHRTGGGSE